jgi:ABC-2 type transport system permease protein
MRHFFSLFRHELRLLFIAPPTYVASVLFILLMGFIYWAILRSMTLVPQDTSAITQFFSLFWLPVFFTVPLLTMRSIAEEKNQATLQTLFSAPVPKYAIVLSKFFAAYLLYLILWVLTLYFPLITFNLLSDNLSNASLVNASEIIGSLIFISLSGILFIAIGIFTSSLTRSQLVAGMLCFTFLFIICIGGQQLEYATYNYFAQGSFFFEGIQYVNVIRHFEDFSLGILDTRPFVFYLSISILLLSLTVNMIDSKA